MFHLRAKPAFLERKKRKGTIRLSTSLSRKGLVRCWTRGKLFLILQHLCQHSVRIQCNFPFSKASQQGAECSSSFAEPLTEEKQVPSRNAMGQGESGLHYPRFMNPSMNHPGCCGTSKWSQFILWTKLASCPSVLCLTCAFRAAQEGSPLLLLTSLLLPRPGDRKWVPSKETNFLALCNLFPAMLCSTCTGSSPSQ